MWSSRLVNSFHFSMLITNKIQKLQPRLVVAPRVDAFSDLEQFEETQFSFAARVELKQTHTHTHTYW